jgi:2,4-dienoyl-CoA reductase-like NADH-dependent reductase (Old Yellow Enzyme family)
MIQTAELATKDLAARAAPLFEPQTYGPLKLANRIVMAPMTRSFSPDGVPTAEMSAYYARRAAADVGLIVTEGVWVDHPSAASADEKVPRFYGEDALAGWRRTVDEVHTAGGVIIPQLWHVGLMVGPEPLERQRGPSGIAGVLGAFTEHSPMTTSEIEGVIDAFAAGAETAQKLGFDGVALHGAHGYLIDQFFWKETNRRSDKYGGSLSSRSAFATEMLQEMRRRTSKDFPIMFRYSQWKLQDYGANIVETPAELEHFLSALTDAGVDIYDCSQRRYWEPTFDGSDLNLAGWTKKITGKPTMTVGSVGLDQELFATLAGETGQPASLDRLMEMLERGDFDLVGVGRALLVDPNWAAKIKSGDFAGALPYGPEAMSVLY